MSYSEQIKTVSKRIVQLFNPQKVILFGSYAYGNPDKDSDVDLLIIMDFQGKGIKKALEILRAVQVPFPCDLIVKTPQELERRYQEYDPIIRAAVNQGIVLYDRNAQRVA
jgi:predicted nucleotidyltransferase